MVTIMLLTVMVEVQFKVANGVTNHFTRLDFPLPPRFVFGAGTSAYQVYHASHLYNPMFFVSIHLCVFLLFPICSLT